MMKSALYSAILILASCNSLSLSSQEHDRQITKNCKFEEQDHKLTCRDLTLSQAPTHPHAESVKMLDLSGNTISKLNPNFFDGYNSVVTLIMTNAKILQIYPDAFHSLKDLQTVDLSNNVFSFVPAELFMENPKLENVTLNNNPLNMQPLYRSILISRSLLQLKLRNCKLSNLSSDSLSKVPKMLSLDLSWNNFEELRIDVVFSDLNLTDINLTGKHWNCSNVFEKMVCWAYRVSPKQPTISCKMKNRKKSYRSEDLRELCDKLSVTTSSVTSITSTPKERVVTTDMTIPTLETVSQSTSPEYTTTVLKEDTRKRSSESHDAFNISTTTQPPRPYDNEGPENSESGSRCIFLCVSCVLCVLIIAAFGVWGLRAANSMELRRQPQQEIREDERRLVPQDADVTVQHPGHVNRDSDLP